MLKCGCRSCGTKKRVGGGSKGSTAANGNFFPNPSTNAGAWRAAGNEFAWRLAALDSNHSRRASDVHDCVYRSNQYLPGPAADQPRLESGSATSGNGRRYLFLGIPCIANPGRPFGKILEPEEIHQRPAGGVGNVCRRLRTRAHLSTIAHPSAAPGSGRERSFSCDSDSTVALVLARRARSRQRFLATLFAGSSHRGITILGMDARPLELAGDASRRGVAAIPVAWPLARGYPGPSSRCRVVARARAQVSGGDAAARIP